ncbi:MAG: hypothetical protein AMXMBFR83_22670 [Phycisphaerae bacterium]
METRLGPEPPRVEALDRDDLSRFVRRLILRKLRDGEDYAPPAVPESLRGLTCRASVTLREQGRLAGTADSGELPVMEAVAQAARAALANAQVRSTPAETDLASLGLEIELAGPRELIGHGGEPPERLARHFEPGIHGIALVVGGREALVRPSQLISMEIFCDDDGELGHRCDRYAIAVANFQEKLGLTRTPPEHPPEEVRVYRFRSTHWYQPRADALPVLLIAGLRPVGPDEASAEALPAVIEDLGRYLVYRQNSDGLFSYEFLPGRDVYWSLEQNWVRQAATAWVLAGYARQRGGAELAAAADRAVAALAGMVRPLPDNPRGKYLYTPDAMPPLGATALLSLAIMDSPEPDRHADLLAGLMTAIEAQARPDGSFRTYFPPSQKIGSQDYYPGEALLAIARCYALHPDAERRALCDRALAFYTRYFRETRVPAFVPWQAQAWGELARTTRLRKYADFVFEMTDYLLGLQVRADALPLAIYDGCIDTTGEGRGGVSSAVYLEGLVDAIRTAESFHEVQRAEQYRRAAIRMARFVVQLRFRPEEAYYIRSPDDVIGGVRNTPIDPTLRIDHVQHALAGLMGLAGLLPPAGGAEAAGEPTVPADR